MSQSDTEYDVLVIGTGPGGEGAAMQATKNGLKVAVVEKHVRIGGGCTHWGTIPSKALRQSIYQVLEVTRHPLYQQACADPLATLSFPELRASAASIIERQETMRQGFYIRNRVPILRGAAKFINANEVAVISKEGAPLHVRAKQIVIAVG